MNIVQSVLWAEPEVTRETDIAFQSSEDIITLSCALYRLTRMIDPKVTSIFEYYSLDDQDGKLAKHITEEDRILAESVRSHFSNKIVLSRLRGANLTRFRIDLGKLLVSNFVKDGKYVYPTTYMGMAYKLPYFYNYDMELMEVFHGDYFSIKGPKTPFTANKLVTFMKKVDSHRKSSNTPSSYEYWFSDELNDRIVLTVEKRNPLIDLLDKIIESPITIHATFGQVSKDTLNFYKASNWKFVPVEQSA